MSRNSILVRLRDSLDRAITYGSRRSALECAKSGLKEALRQDLPAEVEYFAGQVDFLDDRFVSAIEHFDKAIKHNPRDGGSYNDRALCMVELGIIDEALRYFDKGIAAEPDYATIYHNKRWLLNNIGYHGRAIRYFKKALELEPERAVTYDNLADALYNLDDHNGALEAYRKVLKLLKPGTCRGIRKQIRLRIAQIRKEISKKDRNGYKDNRMEEQ